MYNDRAKNLFQPGKIGKLETRNRLVMLPLSTGYRARWYSRRSDDKLFCGTSQGRRWADNHPFFAASLWLAFSAIFI